MLVPSCLVRRIPVAILACRPRARPLCGARSDLMAQKEDERRYFSVGQSARETNFSCVPSLRLGVQARNGGFQPPRDRALFRSLDRSF